MSALFGISNAPTTLLQNSEPAFYAAQSMQQQSSDIQVKDITAQAAEAMSEARTSAQQSATQSEQQIGDQALAYDSSGVQLMGSPMLVLNQSRMLAQQSVNAILARGQSQSNTLLANAAVTANNTRATLTGQQNNLSTSIANSKISTMNQQAAAVGKIAQAAASFMFGGTAADPFAGGGAAPATPGYPIGNP